MGNLLDYSDWTEGTGSVGTWTGTGNNSYPENARVYDTGPFGETALVWETTTEDNTGYGGGWWSAYIALDTAYTYRFTVYVKRLPGANGERTLFGMNDSSSDLFYNVAYASSTSSNPYFTYHYNSANIDEWMLYVGHINPYGYTREVAYNPNGGVWKMDGTKIENADYEWSFYNSTGYLVRSRIFYYDSADKWPTFSDQYVYPRIDRLDGSEPTLEQLLTNKQLSFNFSLGGSHSNLSLRSNTKGIPDL